MIRTKLVEYQCDACLKRTYDPENVRNNSMQWKLNTEIGDLCPECAQKWAENKENFLNQMRGFL